ncbi:MAG TPA: ferredoxin [Acidimicrobiia bacterium]|jgi:ferredoxin
MRITIDADVCTGHGRCYVLAPDLCEPDDRGRGVVSRADVPPELEDQARAAAANCPERAVSLEN